MPNKRGVKVHRFSIIPWDLGVDIKGTTLSAVEAQLSKQGFRRRFFKLHRFEQQEPVVIYWKSFQGYFVGVRIFFDGLAQFIVRPKVSRFDDVRDFDPDVLNLGKWEFHRNILSNRSDLAQLLLETRRKLWSAIRRKHITSARSSASENWESGGISYIFSFFVFSACRDAAQATKSNISMIICPLRRPLSESDHSIEDLLPISERITNDNIEQFCVRKGKDYFYWYSWSSAVCLCHGQSQAALGFFNIVSSVQKTWFSFYSLNTKIDEIADELSAESTYKKVFEFNHQIGEMHRLAYKSKNLNKSMVSELDLQGQRVLWEASKLDELYKGLSQKMSLLKGELETIADYRRSGRLRYLELILLFLAATQAASAFSQLRTPGSLSVHEWIGFGIVVAIAAVVIFRTR